MFPTSTSLPEPSFWVIPVHQPQASCFMHRTWTGDSFHIWYYTCFKITFLKKKCMLYSKCSLFYIYAIPLFLQEKAMAPYSSTLAWKIPWMEEAGRLQSMGSLGVRHDWATSLSLFTFMRWRRKWQPTPVFLPGESQGRGSLVSWRL